MSPRFPPPRGPWWEGERGLLSRPLPLCRQKSSFLPSYIIDVRELDEKLLNIIDMQFLYGYYEPTLLILFEPNQTWPG